MPYKEKNLDPLCIIDATLENEIKTSERQRVRSLIIEKLQRLHEGVLARYGLRPSDYQHWKKIQDQH